MAKQSIDHSHNISSSGHNLFRRHKAERSKTHSPLEELLSTHWLSRKLQDKPSTASYMVPTSPSNYCAPDSQKSPTALYFLHTITILSTNNSLQPEACLASPDHGCFHGGFIVALKGHSPSYEVSQYQRCILGVPTPKILLDFGRYAADPCSKRCAKPESYRENEARLPLLLGLRGYRVATLPVPA